MNMMTIKKYLIFNEENKHEYDLLVTKNANDFSAQEITQYDLHEIAHTMYLEEAYQEDTKLLSIIDEVKDEHESKIIINFNEKRSIKNQNKISVSEFENLRMVMNFIRNQYEPKTIYKFVESKDFVIID